MIFSWKKRHKMVYKYFHGKVIKVGCSENKIKQERVNCHRKRKCDTKRNGRKEKKKSKRKEKMRQRQENVKKKKDADKRDSGKRKYILNKRQRKENGS